MIRRPPRSTLSSSSAASDVYKRQGIRALAPQFPEAFFSTYCQIKFSTVIISATRAVIMDNMVRREENLWAIPLIQYIRQIIRYLYLSQNNCAYCQKHPVW